MARRYRDVMRELVEAVAAGAYPEGTWLPHESELAGRFGCSRGVIREAIRGLEERGLVEVQRARGQRVRQREYWDVRDPDVLRACIERGPEPATLAQAIDARAAVECAAATRALEHATDRDFSMLRSRIGDMERAAELRTDRAGDETDPFVLADAWFHHTLALLSDNAVLAKLVEPLQLVIAQVRHARAPERERSVISHHRRILEGLSSREPDLAAEAISAYAERLARWLAESR